MSDVRSGQPRRRPLGLGKGGPPHRPHESRIVVFDCQVLTEQKYSFSATVYFFICFTVRGRDECPFGGEHSPIIVLARFGGHLKNTIDSPCSLRPGFAPLPRALSGCRAAFSAMLGSTRVLASINEACVRISYFFSHLKVDSDLESILVLVACFQRS